MIILYILSIIGIAAIVVATTDAYVMLSEWVQRIHIGRWNDRKEWQQAIDNKATKWIKRSPTVKIKDENRFILIDILKGDYRSNTIQSWQDAALLMALDEKYSAQYIKQHPRLFEENNIEPDQALLAYALKKNNQLSQEKEEKMRKLFTSHAENNTTIPYRKEIPEIRFVDTIGLVCPFLSVCGYSHIATEQIKEYDKFLLNGIYPPHAFNKENNQPMGVYDWSRGIGWYILGITECAHLDGNKERILRLAEAMLPLQQKSGGFGCMVFNPIQRMETSGTALIGILFLKAYELTNNSNYLNAARKAEKVLMTATRRNGAIDYAQGDTKGIGFYSNTFSIMPFAQGMALYFSKMMNKYEANS